MAIVSATSLSCRLFFLCFQHNSDLSLDVIARDVINREVVNRDVIDLDVMYSDVVGVQLPSDSRPQSPPCSLVT